jgi:hypothetical protein
MHFACSYTCWGKKFLFNRTYKSTFILDWRRENHVFWIAADRHYFSSCETDGTHDKERRIFLHCWTSLLYHVFEITTCIYNIHFKGSIQIQKCMCPVGLSQTAPAGVAPRYQWLATIDRLILLYQLCYACVSAATDNVLQLANH